MGGEFSNWSSHIGDLKYKKKLSIKEYVIKSKSKLIFLLMVIILGVIISSITPYLYGKIIDYIVNGDLKSIKNLLFCFATFNIVSIALSILENVIGTQITIGISNDIKYKIFSHILHLKAKEQDQYSTGELLNRTEGDADAVVSYYINVITSWIMIIINLTVSIYFLLKISKMLTGIGILLLPVNYLINFLFRNRIKIYKLKEKQKEDGYFKFVNIALSSLKNKIFINDINIDELELGKLRRSISYMMKDNLIMPTSLYENIILGCDRVPDNDYLEELCQMLQLNELKNRIGGLWGEINGDMLSSGEKQKVGLARALVNGSNLILLDEATSDMDGSVEKQVVNIIKNLSNNNIIINVCHRRELTFSSKEIYVLKDGMIVEVGSHEELIKKQGIYSSLFDSKAFI